MRIRDFSVQNNEESCYNKREFQESGNNSFNMSPFSNNSLNKNNKMGKIWEKHFLKETNYQTDYNPPVLRQMNNNDQ